MKYFIFTLFTLSILGCTPQQKNLNDVSTLYGTWLAKEESVAMEFKKPNLCQVVVGSFMPPGSAEGTFSVDFSKKPAHIDMLLDDGQRYKSIFEIIDSNKFKLEDVEPYKERPEEFTDESMVLVRQTGPEQIQ